MPVDCPNCGSANADGYDFCISCGRALPRLDAGSPPPPPASPTAPGGMPDSGGMPGTMPAPPPPWAQPQPAPGAAGGGYSPPAPPYGGIPGPGPGYGYGPGGYGPPGAPVAAPVANNMAIAVVATVVGLLCGCIGVLPGIVAIVMASQVNGRLASGDLLGAQRASRSARTWAIVAFVITGTLIVVGIVLNVLGNGSVHFSTSS